jgi:hypothetical protein
MEQILDELKAIKSLLTAMPAVPSISTGFAPATMSGMITPPNNAQNPQTVLPAVPVQPSAQIIPLAGAMGGMGGLSDLGATPTPANTVTDEMITELIQPHIHNPEIKASFQAVLAQMGIPRLHEAKPEHYAELYQKFGAIIAQTAQPEQPLAGTGLI